MRIVTVLQPVKAQKAIIVQAFRWLFESFVSHILILLMLWTDIGHWFTCNIYVDAIWFKMMFKP